MSWFEKYTAYEPMKTTTTTTTAWGGWPIISLRCYKCAHFAFAYRTPACYCASRTVVHGVRGDTCASYLEVGE